MYIVSDMQDVMKVERYGRGLTHRRASRKCHSATRNGSNRGVRWLLAENQASPDAQQGGKYEQDAPKPADRRPEKKV
jgi:hypothetical protein